MAEWLRPLSSMCYVMLCLTTGSQTQSTHETYQAVLGGGFLGQFFCFHPTLFMIERKKILTYSKTQIKSCCFFHSLLELVTRKPLL